MKYNIASKACSLFVGLSMAHMASAQVSFVQQSHSSRPESENVIYLDFDGEVLVDLTWDSSGATITAEPWNFFGNGRPSDEHIESIWRTVADSLIIFDVNVTTDRAVYDATPVTQRQMMIGAPKPDNVVPDRIIGGVASVNSFGKDKVCWQFNPDSAVAVHELGHALGLAHDTLPSASNTIADPAEYYTSERTWASFMGSVASRHLLQWCKGDYDGAGNTQDDIAIIANKLGYIDDLVPNDINDPSLVPTPLSTETTTEIGGMIASSGDVDVYELTIPTGIYELDISAFPKLSGPNPGTGIAMTNLDIKLSLYSSNGGLIASANPHDYYALSYSGSDMFMASFMEPVAAGTYYLAIEGGAQGDPFDGSREGWTNYGSIGEYDVSIEMIPTVSVSTYHESENGDLSGDYQNLSSINLEEGNNIIVGQVGNNGNSGGYFTGGGDGDGFVVTVPSGYKIDSVIVDDFYSEGGVDMFISHKAGSAFTFPDYPIDGSVFVYPSSSPQDISSSFTNLDTEGDHSFWLDLHYSNSSYIGDYQIIITLARTDDTSSLADTLTIEAEDYDEDGFYDTTTANIGGEYRDDAVDIESNALGGYNVGHIIDGEYLDYTIEVLEAGDYEFTFSLASGLASDKAFSIEVDGVDVSGSITFNTGGAGWQSWQDVVVSDIPLSVGVQTIRIVMEANYFNFDNFTITKVTSPTSILIEAEDYDEGGFYDTNAMNLGGEYRTDAVDIGVSSEGGHNVGWIISGEYLDYTIDVGAAGDYDFTFSLASGLASDKAFRIEVDGVDVSGSITFNTGGAGWQSWQDVVVSDIPLSVGVQTIRIVMEANYFNFDNFTITPTGGTVTPSTPVRIEAEDYDEGGFYDTNAMNLGGEYRTDAVDIGVSSEGGHNVGWIISGEYLDYTIDVGAAGDYDFTFSLASGLASDKAFRIEVDGVDVSGSITFNTGGAGWQSWQDVVVSDIPLSAGVQTIRIVMEANHFNFDYFDIQ